jgi:UDPglucose 6-dehydrogenase
MNKIKIAVAGTGYVGLSMSTLLSQHNEVVAVDIVENRVDMINNRISPIKDAYIEQFFEEKKLNLTATLDTSVYKDVEYIIICVPTNYDAEKKIF